LLTTFLRRIVLVGALISSLLIVNCTFWLLLPSKSFYQNEFESVVGIKLPPSAVFIEKAALIGIDYDLAAIIKMTESDYKKVLSHASTHLTSKATLSLGGGESMRKIEHLVPQELIISAYMPINTPGIFGAIYFLSNNQTVILSKVQF